MTARNSSLSIEFIVKPREDLFLDGSVRRLPRVSKGEPYPCQMQKNQTFSCLFRHYAKHNGLKKEDLVFYFVDELLPDQMPETVHMMPQDEIWVEHIKKPGEAVRVPETIGNTIPDQLRALLESEMHADVTFVVGDAKEEVRAHKAIMAARTDYFNAMFKVGEIGGMFCGMSESTQSYVEISGHDKNTFCRMLEFAYTNTVKSMDTSSLSQQELTLLFVMANEYCLDDLQALCECAMSKVLNTENIGRYLLLSAKYGGAVLRDSCMQFVRETGQLLRQNEKFRVEIEESPQLGLLLFDALQDIGTSSSSSSSGSSSGRGGSRDSAGPGSLKRRRITDSNNPEETFAVVNAVLGTSGEGTAGSRSVILRQDEQDNSSMS